MDYYLNEYSLRGQFKNVYDFFDSLRNSTLPVLNEIQKQQGNVIWKKDTLWQSEICAGICLEAIHPKRNERSPELTLLKNQLIKLIYEDHSRGTTSDSCIEVKKYNFDEQYRDNFEKTNCFTKAIENEGRIVSFIHPAYKIAELSVNIFSDGSDKNYTIDNIYTISWWENEPEIKRWEISSKYKIEVRAKEFDFHPPHFHAKHNEFEAVFGLRDGKIYRQGKKKWTPKMITEVQDWYYKNREELQEAWENLHNS